MCIFKYKTKKRERERKVPSDQCCFQKWLLGDSYRRAGQTYADVPWYGFLSSKNFGTGCEIRGAV